MSTFSKLKKVTAKKTAFTRILQPADLNIYLFHCIKAGRECPIYMDPYISNDFYDEGHDIQEALEATVNKYEKAPKKSNYNRMYDAKILGVKWLYSYVEKVEIIANDDANRTTREEAFTNILFSFLTPNKLAQSRKGDPEKPEFKIVGIGDGNARIDILNKGNNIPTNTVFVAIEAPSKDSKAAPAEVKIVKHQLEIRLFELAHVVFQSNDGKGKITYFDNLLRGKTYHVYAYSQSGRKQISKLSNRVDFLS